MLKPKQKKVTDNSSVNALLKSPAFRTLLDALRELHPVKNGLGMAATTEQRAHHQIFCQCFENILTALDKWSVEEIKASLESTYEQPKTHKPNKK